MKEDADEDIAKYDG